MNRYIDMINAVDDLEIQVPLESSVEILVDVGDKVKVGLPLYKVSSKQVAEAHYLPQVLGVKVERCRDYLGRVGGEYVSKGDLLAEKLAAGGLITKRVYAGVDGIVSTQRIASGFLDILSESEDRTISSHIDGVIKSIILNSHIGIQASGVQLPYQLSKDFEKVIQHKGGQLLGKFMAIGTADQIPSKRELDDDYEGMVVFTGKQLHRDLALELYRRNALAIVTYSMFYEDFRQLELPIIVLAGFGNLKMSSELDKFLNDSSESYVVIDAPGQMLKFAMQNDNELLNKYFTDISSLGEASVQILDVVRYLQTGTIKAQIPQELLEEELTIVKVDGSEVIVPQTSLRVFSR